jgi:hypothetical protein
VPCWVDLVQPDVDATMGFYGGLFGWAFELRTPRDAPQRYFYARLDGLTVGAVGGPPQQEGEGQAWTTYVCVDSADAAVERAVAAGGRVLLPAADVGPPGQSTGRPAVVADPAGAAIGLWEPADLHGAQLVNAPGSWNFSDLQIDEPRRVEQFYAELFGWELDVLEFGGDRTACMWRLPGYGDFLAAADPEFRARQASAPSGFADVVALGGFIAAADATQAMWGTGFAVADADVAVDRAGTLGATQQGGIKETRYTRSATVRDPQGAVITLNQYIGPT